MLNNIKIEDILFLDIETVPQYYSFEELPDFFSKLWEQKSSFFRKNDQTASDVYERAGIYAEFGKIICISVGYLHKPENETLSLRLKTFYGHDEKEILENFIQILLLKRKTSSRPWIFCAHNGKEFDFPYISRRLIVNSLQLPPELDFAGKRPWDIPHLDTMELWKFGDYKNYTSLNLLSTVLGIPSPKDDIDGSMVGKVYWEEGDLKRIVSYCEKDVIAIVRLFQRMSGKEFIQDEFIISTTS
jgi:uncharacterized protein YprB with RNaseH-like and TPR domain